MSRKESDVPWMRYGEIVNILERFKGGFGDAEKWFVFDPRDGRMWMVPVKDIDAVIWETGFIAPWIDGWIPVYKDGVYIGYGANNDGGSLHSLQRIAFGKSKCTRGPTWRWSDQDGGGHGVISTRSIPGWVTVEWSTGIRNGYRYGLMEDEHRVYNDIFVINEGENVPVNEEMMKKYERLRIV